VKQPKRLLADELHASTERGASLIEFALVLPVLLMLLVGIVTSAQAWNRQNTLQHVTREAARFGATLGPWNSAAEAQVQAVIDTNLDVAGLNPASVVSCIDMGDNPCSLDSGGAVADDLVGVAIFIPNYTMDFVFFSATTTLDSSAVARYER
jgi:hypothetical protein